MAIDTNLDPPSEPTLEEALDALRAAGNAPRREGPDEWVARCTAHDDHAPSMALTRGDKRPLMLYCRSKQCAYEDMLAGIFPDREWPQPVRRNTPPSATTSHRQGLTLAATYTYADELGEVLYEVRRFEPKTFRQRKPDGNGGWVNTLGDVRRVLYGLPRVLEAVTSGEPVYLVEGEKDADRILELGIAATTMAGGSAYSKRTQDATEILKPLAGCALAYIVADRDAPGREHAKRVARILEAWGVAVELLEPAIVTDKADVSDHLDAGKALHELEPMRDDPQDPPESEAPQEPLRAAPRVYSRKAITYGIERVHWLADYEGFIPLGMVTLAAGLPGLGKSMLVCYLAAAESRAGRTVCIAAAEDSIEHVLIPRLVAAKADLNLVEFIGYEDEHGDGSLHLPDHGDMLRATVASCKPSLFMVDPIGSFLGRAVDAWKDTDVRQALGPFKTIAEENGCACILVAHLNKGTGPFLKRISNSAAFGQFVRSGLLFGRDPDDPDREKGNQRILVSGKLNVGAIPDARCYRVETAHIPSHDGTPPDIATARLVYSGTSMRSTEDLLAASERPTIEASPETKEAMLMLAEILNGAPVPRARIGEEAKKWGLSMKPVYNAADRMGIVMESGGFQQGTTWRLP